MTENEELPEATVLQHPVLGEPVWWGEAHGLEAWHTVQPGDGVVRIRAVDRNGYRGVELVDGDGYVIANHYRCYE